MSTYHQLLLAQERLLEQSGYTKLMQTSPVIETLERQLKTAMFDADRQQRPQHFVVLIHGESEKSTGLLLTLHYEYDPDKKALHVNAIDGFITDRACKFIPLKADRLPSPAAIEQILLNPKQTNEKKWASEHKARPMQLLAGTHKRRRAL